MYWTDQKTLVAACFLHFHLPFYIRQCFSHKYLSGKILHRCQNNQIYGLPQAIFQHRAAGKQKSRTCFHLQHFLMLPLFSFLQKDFEWKELSHARLNIYKCNTRQKDNIDILCGQRMRDCQESYFRCWASGGSGIIVFLGYVKRVGLVKLDKFKVTFQDSITLNIN